MYSSLVDDSSHYLGGRESGMTYIANGLCFGFEAYEGACERELEPGHTLCSRCTEVEQAYRDDAEEDARRKRRWRLGLFTDEEKEIVRETLNDAERFEFDQKCAMAEFLEGLRTCVRSQAEFVLADIREDPDMLNVAAAVTLWRNGRFQTVKDIVDQCANHRWNAAIYEMWVFGNRASSSGCHPTTQWRCRPCTDGLREDHRFV